MKLKTAAAVFCAAVLCSAGGCSITDIGSEDMLRPPKTMGDEAEIEKLIDAAAPGGYTLKYPNRGANRSAIIMHDLDGDNIDEAIAFFREKSGSAGVHMLVMYDESGTWKTAADVFTETTDVDCVDFANINGGSTQEILVGFPTYSAGVNFLTVYTYEKGKIEDIKSGQNYSAFYCGNLDGSGKDNIILLSLFSTENDAAATILEYDSTRKTLYPKAETPMDGNIVSYQNVVFSELSDNINGLVVDGLLQSGDLNTQVIYYDKEQSTLRNPLYKEKVPNPTQRGSEVLSTDIGNDMRYEIPTVSTLPFNAQSGASAAAKQIIWNHFNIESQSLVPIQRTVANYNYTYTIRIPDGWRAGVFTALLNDSGTLMTFCEWDKDTAGNKLFDVMVFSVSDWDQGNASDDYKLIYKDNRYAYAFKNYKPESALALDDNDIKTAFALLGKSAANSNGNKS